MFHATEPCMKTTSDPKVKIGTPALYRREMMDRSVRVVLIVINDFVAVSFAAEARPALPPSGKLLALLTASFFDRNI